MSREDSAQGEGRALLSAPDHADAELVTHAASSSMATTSPSLGAPTSCFDPRRFWFRWFVLVFICFINFGSYYCYDNPAALEVRVPLFF
jgi:hypothetical protein